MKRFKWIAFLSVILGVIGLYSIALFGPLLVMSRQTEPVIITEPVVEQAENTYTTRATLRIVVSFQSEAGAMQKGGSAVIISEDEDYYYLITNYHNMVESGFVRNSIQLIDFLGGVYDAEVMFTSQLIEIASESYDLALIRTSKTFNHSIAHFSSVMLRDGLPIRTVGYPNGIRSYSEGVVIETKMTNHLPFEMIIFNAEIDHGSSGGALLDSNGNLLGITTLAGFDSSGSFIQGYAIPLQKIIEYMDLFKLQGGNL
jgi:S1-C subfamily serine protease